MKDEYAKIYTTDEVNQLFQVVTNGKPVVTKPIQADTMFDRAIDNVEGNMDKLVIKMSNKLFDELGDLALILALSAVAISMFLMCFAVALGG